MTTHEPASDALDPGAPQRLVDAGGSVPAGVTDPVVAAPADAAGRQVAVATNPDSVVAPTPRSAPDGDLALGSAPADARDWAAPDGSAWGTRAGGGWASVDGLVADETAGAGGVGALALGDGSPRPGVASPPGTAAEGGDVAQRPGAAAAGAGAAGGGEGRRSFRHRLAWGRADDPRWARPALWMLLAATAVLYLWGLGRSGWANAFYSAAAQAGSKSWEALFFGSSDAGNAITVDKPPVAMWLMGLSVRIFGLSSWSVLVPEALCGVASVGLLYATVRRAFSPAAGLIAGAVLATTPVAVLMFRFNNPDALLVLLLIGAAYATLRAVERASARWLALAGVLVGFGFLTKMLQAFLIVPVLALAYLVAAPTGWWPRVRHVLAAGLALVISAGWYLAVVALVPASHRPYIGGSQHNSLWELTFGYNGFGRLTGHETGSVGGGGARLGGGGRAFGPRLSGGGWGATGWGRLFNLENGGQIAWLLPAALALLVAGLVVTARRPRTDRARAAFIVWGGWLLVTWVVFSQMQGIFHAYYSVALAPAIGALIGMGAVALWERRASHGAALTLAGLTLVTAWWCGRLLGRTSGWHAWLRPTVLVIGIAAAVLLVGLPRLPVRAGLAVAGLALVGSLLGPTSYALATAGTAHSGAIPSAGPSVAAARPGGAGGFAGRIPGQGGGRGFGQGGTGQGGTGSFPGFGVPGGAPTMPGGGTTGQGGAGQGGPGLFGGFGGGRAGGMGGLLGATAPGADLTALLKQNASAYRWAAAVVGSENAAGYQLASEAPVMAIGGFNGTDPSPTLAQFKQYVADGKIHYFIGSGLAGTGNGGSDAAGQIAAWVRQNFTAKTVDGVTIYDLTATAHATGSSPSTSTAQTT
jgi:4-amino-4-deoxy-L-arabinose transferase-like glycosyltransferase